MLKDDLYIVMRRSGTLLKSLGVLCCLLLWAGESWAENSRFRGGLRNSPEKRRLTPKQLKVVLESLRAKTGWHELFFDEEGFLVCPEPDNFAGGSAAARRLLGEALFSQQAFDLEAHNHTSQVLFARLAVAIAYESRRTGARIDAYPLQIDFADFGNLRGGGEVLQAFDIGLVILHELAHGVWFLRDAKTTAEDPGECETYVNRIRRELGLPERQTYQAKVRSSAQNFGTGTRYFAELLFARPVEKNGKIRHEQFILKWDAVAVGQMLPVFSEQRPAMAATFR